MIQHIHSLCYGKAKVCKSNQKWLVKITLKEVKCYLADLIERTCRHAQRFAEGLQQAGYSVLNDVVLNQVLVSFGSAEKTPQVIAGIQSDGTCWCGGTIWQGQAAMRISVSSWATTDADVECSLEAMLRAAAGFCSQPGRFRDCLHVHWRLAEVAFNQGSAAFQISSIKRRNICSAPPVPEHELDHPCRH